MKTACQIFIALLGVTAIFLSQDKRLSWRRWSSVLGLCSQPFWFALTYIDHQWGVFGLCFLYTWCWFRGFKTNWLDNRGKSHTGKSDE